MGKIYDPALIGVMVPPPMSANGRGQRSATATREASSPIPNEKSGPVLMQLSDVEPQPVSWLWPGRVPRGKLLSLSGDPGLGKSMLALDIAARVTTGAVWPDGGISPSGAVVLLSAEDAMSDTLRPRFDVLGGDPTKLHVLRAIRGPRGDLPVDLSRDVKRVEEAVTSTDAVLLIIDPIDAYLGGQIDSHKNSSIRRVLSPVSDLAERTGAAICMVMHLSKAEDRKAIYRTLGSIGYIGAARVGLVVDLHPDDKRRPVGEQSRRVLATTKSNVSAEARKLAYLIRSTCPQCRAIGVGPVCGTCGQTSVGLLQWSDEPVRPMTADELLGSRSSDTSVDGPQQGPREDAKRFLVEALASGDEIESAWFVKTASENGISKKTLYRAKSDLGICARLLDRGTPRQRWMWSLLGSIMTDEEARQYAASRRQARQP